MASSKSIEQILGHLTLTGTIKATRTGIPFPLPEAFLNTSQRVVGDSGRYTRITGTRRTARLAQYGSPAVKRELKDVGSVDVKLLHTFEEITIPPLVMQNLRNYNNYDLQQLGIDEVARQTGEFKQYFVNLRYAAIQQILSLGAVYFDGNGNFLPTSSGAVVTLDMGVPANNKNQLNGIISARWDNATTDIGAQIRTLHQQALQISGYPLKYAFYGVNIPSYVTNNDFWNDYLSRNPGANDRYTASGELPEGMAGLTWIPTYTGFFEDSGGTNQTIMGANQVTFTPEPSADWWDVLEGSYLVPTTLKIEADAAAAIASLKQVWGMFAYAAIIHNPVTANEYVGDTFLPVLKVPASCFLSTVVF